MSLEPSPPPLGPASDALTRLLEPYRHERISLREYQTLVALGALAWNFASLPEDEREKYLGEAMRRLDDPESAALREMIQTLVRRKEQLFAHDRRLILEYEVTEIPTGYHLIVASADLHDS